MAYSALSKPIPLVKPANTAGVEALRLSKTVKSAKVATSLAAQSHIVKNLEDDIAKVIQNADHELKQVLIDEFYHLLKNLKIATTDNINAALKPLSLDNIQASLTKLANIIPSINKITQQTDDLPNLNKIVTQLAERVAISLKQTSSTNTDVNVLTQKIDTLTKTLKISTSANTVGHLASNSLVTADTQKTIKKFNTKISSIDKKIEALLIGNFNTKLPREVIRRGRLEQNEDDHYNTITDKLYKVTTENNDFLKYLVDKQLTIHKSIPTDKKTDNDTKKSTSLIGKLTKLVKDPLFFPIAAALTGLVTSKLPGVLYNALGNKFNDIIQGHTNEIKYLLSDTAINLLSMGHSALAALDTIKNILEMYLLGNLAVNSFTSIAGGLRLRNIHRGVTNLVNTSSRGAAIGAGATRAQWRNAFATGNFYTKNVGGKTKYFIGKAPTTFRPMSTKRIILTSLGGAGALTAMTFFGGEYMEDQVRDYISAQTLDAFTYAKLWEKYRRENNHKYNPPLPVAPPSQNDLGKYPEFNAILQQHQYEATQKGLTALTTAAVAVPVAAPVVTSAGGKILAPVGHGLAAAGTRIGKTAPIQAIRRHTSNLMTRLSSSKFGTVGKLLNAFGKHMGDRGLAALELTEKTALNPWVFGTIASQLDPAEIDKTLADSEKLIGNLNPYLFGAPGMEAEHPGVITSLINLNTTFQKTKTSLTGVKDGIEKTLTNLDQLSTDINRAANVYETAVELGKKQKITLYDTHSFSVTSRPLSNIYELVFGKKLTETDTAAINSLFLAGTFKYNEDAYGGRLRRNTNAVGSNILEFVNIGRRNNRYSFWDNLKDSGLNGLDTFINSSNTALGIMPNMTDIANWSYAAVGKKTPFELRQKNYTPELIKFLIGTTGHGVYDLYSTVNEKLFPALAHTAVHSAMTNEYINAQNNGQLLDLWALHVNNPNAAFSQEFKESVGNKVWAQIATGALAGDELRAIVNRYNETVLETAVNKIKTETNIDNSLNTQLESIAGALTYINANLTNNHLPPELKDEINRIHQTLTTIATMCGVNLEKLSAAQVYTDAYAEIHNLQAAPRSIFNPTVTNN